MILTGLTMKSIIKCNYFVFLLKEANRVRWNPVIIFKFNII